MKYIENENDDAPPVEELRTIDKRTMSLKVRSVFFVVFALLRQ
jgi:hypothetical protein